MYAVESKMQNSYNSGSTLKQAAFRALSCQESIDNIAEDLRIPRKQFRNYLYSHGHSKVLDTPIILFDLNGTLCNRTERNKVITLRPNIHELKKLKKAYRIGVYTSVTRYNALLILDAIEDVCGRIFDRHLIFTREHTFPFTDSELLEYDLKPYKTKKCLTRIFAPEYIPKIRIIDDEHVRVEDKDNLMCIKPWYGDCETDQSLVDITRTLLDTKNDIVTTKSLNISGLNECCQYSL